jgi:aldehyde dehydrogenase (NAD+)
MKNGNSIEKVSHEMDRPSVKDLALDFGKAWEYAPSPEATDHVKLQSRYELFVDGKWSRPEEREVLRHGEPEHRGDPRRGGRGHLRGRRPRGARGPKVAYDGVWSRMRPEERGKYIFRIARAIQEKARELAILETMDGGKPIRESPRRRRPARGRALFLLRGLGRQARLRLRGRGARPLGVAGQIIPWNFPLLMAAWKIAPGARVRQHGGAEARRDHAAHR